MSGYFVLLCDCSKCRASGQRETLSPLSHDISTARLLARSETLREDCRWTGDGESDYAPGHEAAEMDGTNSEFARVEERAQFIRLIRAGGDNLEVWPKIQEDAREYYRELARQELLAYRKRVRGLG